MSVTFAPRELAVAHSKPCGTCRFYTVHSGTCALTWARRMYHDTCVSHVLNDDKQRYGYYEKE